MADYVLKQSAEEIQKAIDNALTPDTTLEQSGVPADAKAVGEAILRASENVIGGYYVPHVTQQSANEAKFSFGASDPEMPDVPDVKITLPAGPQGLTGEKGEQGEKGEKGEAGYTPVKNVDYFDGKDGKDGSDGYTPQKGVDYFDGQNGQNGSDGKDGNGIKSAVLNADYTLTLNFDDGTSYTTPSIRGETGATGDDGVGIVEIVQTTQLSDGNGYDVRLTDGSSYYIFAPAGPQGKPGTDGKNGSNGVSATHSWNGTTLTITSASGTSSSDLKGEKGDPGRGIQADWNQNDSAAEDYVKNRPFYDATTYDESVVVPERQIEFSGGEKPYYNFTWQHVIGTPSPTHYIVYLGGYKYVCEPTYTGNGFFIECPGVLQIGFISPSNFYLTALTPSLSGAKISLQINSAQANYDLVKLPNKYLDEEYIKGLSAGTSSITPDNETLILENGLLRVNTADEPDPDNTLPITAAAVYATAENKANKTDLTSHTGNTTAHVTAAERTAWNKKLDGVAVDIRKEIAFGSSGKLCIGKFKIYDTQVTVDITATTASTYSGKLVIAAQNYLIKEMKVYGDAADTIAPNIFVKPSTASDPYIEVYFSPLSWSKNIIHIYGNEIKTTENVCTNVSSIPDTATQKPVNALTENFSAKSHTHTIDNVSGLQSALDGKETSGAAATALAEAKAYTDEAVSGIGGGGGSSSWDGITGKPFITVGSPDTLTWDGDTTGRVVIPGANGGSVFVSDAVPTTGDFSGGAVVRRSDGTEHSLNVMPYGNTIILMASTYTGYGFVATVDNANDAGIVFPKAGVYFAYETGGVYTASLTINGYAGFAVKEKIDPSCLPDGSPYTEQDVPVLPETTVEIDPDSGEGYILDEFELVGGNTYTVMWNGTKYSCVAQSLSEDGLNGICLGDIGVLLTGEPVTGEPFVVVAFYREAVAEMGVSAILIALDGSASVTLSITGEVVHKLDAKYLPNTVLLYVSEDDRYLYKSADVGDVNNRVTNMYLRPLFLGASKVLICSYGVYSVTNDDGAVELPYTAYRETNNYIDYGGYGAIVYYVGSYETVYYTAEYEG